MRKKLNLAVALVMGVMGIGLLWITGQQTQPAQLWIGVVISAMALFISGVALINHKLS